MFTFKEVLASGRIMFPRRRVSSGEGGLMWHMALEASLRPSQHDNGLLVFDTLEKAEHMANKLRGMRTQHVGSIGESKIIVIDVA